MMNSDFTSFVAVTLPKQYPSGAPRATFVDGSALVFPGTKLGLSYTNWAWDKVLVVPGVTSGAVTSVQRSFGVLGGVLNSSSDAVASVTYTQTRVAAGQVTLLPYTRAIFMKSAMPSYSSTSTVFDNTTNDSVTVTLAAAASSVVIQKVFAVPYARFHTGTDGTGSWIHYYLNCEKVFVKGIQYCKCLDITSKVTLFTGSLLQVEYGDNAFAGSIVLGPNTGVDVSANGVDWLTFNNIGSSATSLVNLDDSGFANCVRHVKIYMA
jgi:hypothetical protein